MLTCVPTLKPYQNEQLPKTSFFSVGASLQDISSVRNLVSFQPMLHSGATYQMSRKAVATQSQEDRQPSDIVIIGYHKLPQNANENISVSVS